MVRVRLAIWLIVAFAAIGWGFLATTAKPGAMPAAQGTPGATRERQPSQYAFYPSDVAQPGGDLPGDPAIALVQVTDQLTEPVNVAAPNDGSGRIFVVERGGTIRIVEQDGSVLEEPFLDISGDVTTDFLEQGLLGLAFHPDFASNGLFYVNYTNQLHGGDVLTMQYQVSADDPNAADPASGLIVWSRDQPYPNHIGGDIGFDPAQLTIPADTDVTFVLPNKGANAHNVSIEELDVDVDIAPGETEEITINAPAGNYTYVCDIPGHEAAGMVGELTVE